MDGACSTCGKYRPVLCEMDWIALDWVGLGLEAIVHGGDE